MDCIFCKIVKKEINTPFLYEDEQIIAFEDVDPKAPHHLLIIPKKHIATLNDLGDDDANLMGRMILAAKKLATDRGIAEDGYRILMNCNEQGGQAVYHIHLHLLGGRAMQWPPG